MNREQHAAHRFLSSYRTIVRQVEASADAYAAAVSAATKVTAAADSVGGSSPGPSSSRMADAAAAMLAHADTVAAMAVRASDFYMQREQVIAAVAETNGLHGEILTMFYAEGLSGTEIAAWLGRDRAHPYARSSVYRLRDRALSKAWAAMRELGYRAPE